MKRKTAKIRLIVREVAEKKGIDNPFVLASETGLNYAICYKLWHEKQQRVDLKTLGTLCKSLKVKPGDLFEYPDSDK